MRTALSGLALCALAAVAGCGQVGGDSLGGRIYDTVMAGRADSAPAIESPGFTGQLIAERPQDFMVAEIPGMGLNQPARILMRNGREETWQMQGGATFAFDDGMLVATRGLIDDLLVTDGTATRTAIRAGGGTVQRAIESLDSLDRLSTEVFTCEVTSEGAETLNLGLREVTLRKFVESCANNRLAFRNTYWLDAAGEIISSRQFVSSTVAYLRSNRL